MNRTHRHARAVAATSAVLALLTGCGSADTASTGGSPGQSGSAASGVENGTLNVLAAASLRGVFTRIGEEFEQENPGVDVEFSFAGSSDLVTQVQEGAPADVFASADERNMAKLTASGDVEGNPVPFATNTLRIVTPPGNPAGVRRFADLARPGLAVVVCAPQVPCGAATAAVEESTGTDVVPVSEESSVADVLGKVTSGEADAGVVYVTDAIAAGSAVTPVDFPESDAVVNTYPIAALRETGMPAAAAEFVEFVTGPQGAAALAAAGFGAAPDR